MSFAGRRPGEATLPEIALTGSQTLADPVGTRGLSIEPRGGMIHNNVVMMSILCLIIAVKLIGDDISALTV